MLCRYKFEKASGPANSANVYENETAVKSQSEPEILFGQPPRMGADPGIDESALTEHCETDMLRYCTTLSSALSNIHRQVHEALPEPAAGPLHKLQPGDFVVVRDFTRKNWHHQWWIVPYQVLLTTYTAMKVAERAVWIHASHCKKVPGPEDSPTHKDGPDGGCATPPLQGSANPHV